MTNSYKPNKGDKPVKNNVRKRDFRCHVMNVGASEFPKGIKNHYMSLTGNFAGGTIGSDTYLKEFSELWYLTKWILNVKIKNIVSVDHEKSVVDANKKVTGFPYGVKPRCIHGDIKDVVKEYVLQKKIIDFLVLDFMRTPEKEIENLKEIFGALSFQKEKAVVLMNFVVKSRNSKVIGDPLKIHERLSADKELKRILKFGKWEGWIKPFLDYQFISQPSRTKMKSIVFIKR